MSSTHPITTILFSTWRFSRLWVTLLWAMVLALGVAGLDGAERHLQDLADGQSVTLMPRQAMDEEGRRAAREKMLAEPGVAQARWLGPEVLAKRLQNRFDGLNADLLMTGEGGELPWLLEATPSGALTHPERVRAMASRWNEGGGWTVLWNGPQLDRLLEIRRAVWATGGLALVLVLLVGAGALYRTDYPLGPVIWSFKWWSAILGIATPGAVWAAAWLAGAPVDGRALGVVAGVGLVFATLIAPMIRVRTAQPMSPSLSMTISEDSDERIRENAD